MALTGAQLRSVLATVGASSGQVAGWDQLAAGANDALNRLKKANGGKLSVDQAAGFMASLAMEGAYFKTTTEYGSGQRYAPYIGRTFEQLTWPSNYAGFGAWAKSQGLITDANLFVKNPAQLSNLQWAWLGGVYYWTTSRSWGQYKNMLDVAATGSILAISRAINVGTPNTSATPYGMGARTTMWDAFRRLGTALLPSSSGGTPAKATATPAKQSTPAGAIPGTAAMVLKAANDLWNHYKGKLYCYAWPGWRELGYGISSGYWCAAFVSLAFKKSTGFDWKNSVGRAGPAYCPALVAGMSKSSMWREVKYHDAQGGDVVFFFHGSVAYHTGLVEFGPTSATSHDMRTIEGNTSTPGMSSSMSAGGTLAKKTRDDRYFTMRIFRPTYWAEAATTDTSTGEQTTPDTVDASITVVNEHLDVNSIEFVDDPGITSNPIDALNVRPGFWAAMLESTSRTSTASLWLDGQVAIRDLPLDLSNCKVSVDASQPVRRKASIKLVLDQYSGHYRELMQALEYPGMRLRIDSGFGWAGDSVPIFDGLWDDPKFDGNVVTNECPDAMAVIAMAGHTTTVCSDQSLTFVEHIRGMISDADFGAHVIDLTGNTEKVPYVIWEPGTSSRIDAAMSLAAAIGAELFKSPVPGYYVLRPALAPDSAPKWHVDESKALVSLSKQVSWSKVKNGVAVTSDRADSARMVGEWHDETEGSPTRWGGPFGFRPGFMTTSLIGADREALEVAAQSICQRLIGGRVDVDWTQLVNPLFEAGDPLTLSTSDATYAAILDSFEIPLGSGRTTPGKARSLHIDGLS